MKMGKKFRCIMVGMLITSMAMTGCGKGGAGNETSNNEDMLKYVEVTNAEAEPITLPISEEGISITYFGMPEPQITSKMKGYADMKVHQEAEELTGITIEWREESYTDPKQKMNLMFSTGDIDDVIWDAHKHANGGAKKLLEEELIIPLNAYIEDYAPNLKKLILETPGLLEEISTDEGVIYMFPEIRLDPKTRSNSGFAIREDWLKKLGLDAPETIDDWYEVLTAFKTQDPNGNGEQDEIPFVSLGRSKGSQSLSNFAPAFGILDNFYVKDGVVGFGPYTPEYEEYIRTMAKWYAEGLLDTEFSTQDSKTFTNKMVNNTGGSYYGSLSGNLGEFTTVMKNDPEYDLLPVSMPKSPDGNVYVQVDAYAKMVPHGAVIGANNEHIIETVKWLDWHYSQEGSMLYNWGVEGEAYEVVEGKKQFTDLVMENPDGLSVVEANVRYAGGVISQMPIVNDPEVFMQMKGLPQQLEAIELWSKQSTEMIMPVVFFDAETTTENANILSEVNTYVSEMFNQYVMGIKPLDDFDTYYQTIKDLGMDTVVKNYQEAYDRLYK